MKVYAGMDPRMDLREVRAYVLRVEAMGYDALQVPETVHDSLAVALLALEHTTRLRVRTSVTLAFARSPVLVAYSAWDLSRFSGGRFELGLGTQIRQNVEDRLGMPWGDPVGRLRDYIAVVRAAFAAFRTGEPIAVADGHYRVRRLQPYFNPGPDPATAEPPVWIGGVNPRVCALAGEVAGGLVTHPTNSSPAFLEQHCIPHVRAGLSRAGRNGTDFELVAGTPVVSGPTEAAVATERERQRRLFAFLYSTPAYAPTLALHGWGDLGGRLRRLIRDDRWDALGSVLPDEVMDALVPTGTYAGIAAMLLDRFAGVAQGITFPPPADPAHDGAVAGVVAALRAQEL